MSRITRGKRRQLKLRIALLGPTGSGKSYTAYQMACQLGSKVGVIDTERESSLRYADKFQFDYIALNDHSVRSYINAIEDFRKHGADVLVIDSLSHAWAGKGGVLEFVDAKAKATGGGNSYAAWRHGTAEQNQLVDAIMNYPGHIVATMRVKMGHSQEKDPVTGKTIIRKIGLQPVQRDDLEYEFDVVADITQDHDLSVSKTRCSQIDGKIINLLNLVDGLPTGVALADALRAWAEGGEVAELPKQEPKAGALPAGEEVNF